MKHITLTFFLAIAMVFMFSSCEDLTIPDPSSVDFTERDLYGIWLQQTSSGKDGTYYEEYKSNKNGYYWDVSPDVDIPKSDAKEFTWELEVDDLTWYLKYEEVGGTNIVRYTITTLNSTTLTYTDGLTTKTFKKQ